jgi:hypothetical protein
LVPGYGCDEDGGYNPLTKAYKKDRSIELYVRLRRKNPNAEIAISFLGGMDELLFMQPELEKFGFDPQLVASAMDAELDAISELSLQIMEKMVSAKSLSGSGKTHLARRGLVAPDKLINWLICIHVGSAGLERRSVRPKRSDRIDPRTTGRIKS